MPRLAGVDIPERKKVLYSLQYIHGIGPKYAADICEQAGIDPDRLAQELNDEELSSINALLDSSFVVEGALRRQVGQDIQRLKDIRSYRGDRHRRGLPVHGQRTRCNARTRKGRKKTVAGKKGVKG
ncbi:MAG: 30S ribosomal protein S13 [Phycisphaera sp. TMED9]|nr:MAG: 30S ribosomal protein S13 [Phycisphaera sp. TMED9]